LKKIRQAITLFNFNLKKIQAYIINDIPRSENQNGVQNILEASCFKPVFTERMKSIKHKDATGNPLELTHIPIAYSLDKTKDDERIIRLPKSCYISITARQRLRTASTASSMSLLSTAVL
jgi:hypothetical protein